MWCTFKLAQSALSHTLEHKIYNYHKSGKYTKTQEIYLHRYVYISKTVPPFLFSGALPWGHLLCGGHHWCLIIFDVHPSAFVILNLCHSLLLNIDPKNIIIINDQIFLILSHYDLIVKKLTFSQPKPSFQNSTRDYSKNEPHTQRSTFVN